MSKKLSLQPFFYRAVDGDIYLIPKALIKDFDALKTEIDLINQHQDDDKYYALTGEFEKEYGSYRIEGSIYDITLWINPSYLK